LVLLKNKQFEFWGVMPETQVIFCQVTCGQWEQEDGRLQNAVFALSTEGKIYKFVGSGWRELPNTIVQ
jgi:hypothetical protein